MIDERKIILMAKLAVYDKNEGVIDKKINGYFERDFVYKQNFWTRVCAFFGGVIIWGFYFCNKIIVDNVDILSIDIIAEIKKFLFFIIVLLAVYTVIGWLVSSYTYNVSQTRLKKYFRMLDQLENTELPKSDADNFYAGFLSERKNAAITRDTSAMSAADALNLQRNK